MKKLIYLILLLFFIPISLFSAITGAGTFLDPYTGTLSSGNLLISGIKYFDVIAVSGNGVLTIDPGSTFFGAQTTSQISVTGTGILSAVGGQSNLITISADNNGNGSHDAGETWRDIYFFGSGASQINYAIIEYGTGNSTNNNGGGIYILGKNISIKNTEIRNCTGVLGGGIYATSNASGSITLENLKIHDNDATGGSPSNGGGMFIGGTGASVDVSGCEVYNNDATTRGDGIYINNGTATSNVVNSLIYNHSSGDGIYFPGPAANANIINCTIADNTIGVFFNTATAPVVSNTIVWKNTSSQLSGSGTPVITYCGIQGGYSGTGNVNLSSNNGDASGPNFTTVGSDWSIKFISPLRDAGTSGGSPTPPSTDFAGKSRIFNYDIGAYEVQYSRWTGASSTTWSTSGNWAASVDPGTGTGDVVIPSGLSTYPNVTTSQDFTIGTGKFMNVEPGAQVTLNGLTNNGTLNLKSNASSIFSLMLSSYSRGSGAAEDIQLYLTGGASTLWHYISSPVSSIPITLFSSVIERSVVRYEENYITNDWNNGWVNYEGYHYNPTANQWQSGAGTWSTLDAGIGYNYNSSSSERTFAISGQINTGNTTVNLNYASGGTGTPAVQGYNLIGNPFTSAIDWNAVISSSLNTGQGNWGSVEQAIYFRSNGSLYVYNGSVTVPGDKNGEYLAPMQGCFIKSNINNFTLYIPASAKVHSTNSRFKGTDSGFKGAEIIPLVRLQINNSGKSDQTVVRFDDKATLVFDNEFDARKLYPTSDIPSISTSIAGTEYTINGIPFPETSINIPVLFSAPTTGAYSITANELNGLENYKVVLTDKEQNSSVNLSKVGSYSFNSLLGKYSDRFILTISDINSSVPEIGNPKADFNIYFSQGAINIQTVGSLWEGLKGDIKLFDLTGRQLLTQNNNEFQSGGLLQIPVNLRTGAYLVEIRSGVKRYVGKVVIR